MRASNPKDYLVNASWEKIMILIDRAIEASSPVQSRCHAVPKIRLSISLFSPYGTHFLTDLGSKWDSYKRVGLFVTGHGSMGISNSIGSNTFDILLCLGLPWLIKASLTPAVEGNHWVRTRLDRQLNCELYKLTCAMLCFAKESWLRLSPKFQKENQKYLSYTLKLVHPHQMLVL